MGSGTTKSGARENGRQERAVDRINELISSDESERYTKLTKEFNKFKAGEKVSLYSPELSEGDYKAMPGIVNDVTTYTRTADGNWRSDGGDIRSNSDLRRSLQNYNRKIASGEIDTSDQTKITGKFGKDYNGLRYAKGVYDISRRGEKLAYEKASQEGLITEYNGTLYGVVKGKEYGKSTYKITHIPSGLGITSSADRVKTLAEASDVIKRMDAEIKSGRYADVARRQEERFKKTIRAKK